METIITLLNNFFSIILSFFTIYFLFKKEFHFTNRKYLKLYTIGIVAIAVIFVVTISIVNMVNKCNEINKIKECVANFLLAPDTPLYKSEMEIQMHLQHLDFDEKNSAEALIEMSRNNDLIVTNKILKDTLLHSFFTVNFYNLSENFTNKLNKKP
ncbi:MAG TPA: hypothetical protein PKN48_08380 [Bacteroidales bacterium]|nr:hypothetical protein [Bacteroidales bacterium]